MKNKKYSLYDIAKELEFYSKNKKPHSKFINAILKKTNIKYELIQTKKDNGNSFYKLFYYEDALNYVKNKCKFKNIKLGTNFIDIDNLRYIVIYGKNSKYEENDKSNLCNNNIKKKSKFVLFSPCQHIPEMPDFFYKGGFYCVNRELYPQVTKVKRNSKKYTSKARAEIAQNSILKNSGQIFNIMEV